jgi:hypothetical protein
VNQRERDDDFSWLDCLWYVLITIGVVGTLYVSILGRVHEQKTWQASHSTDGGATIFTDSQTGCRFMVGGWGWWPKYTQILRADGKPDCGLGADMGRER